MNILNAEAREILDSRGVPTVEVRISDGVHEVIASVPSGKSTGANEAHEKRDSDGKGVTDVLTILNEEVFLELKKNDFASQRELDNFLIKLDGTPNKSRIGANGILAISIAFAKLQAKASDKPLWQFISDSEHFVPSYPRIYMNMMNGGAHANFRLPFQEYIVVLGGNPSVSYVRAQEIFSALGEVIKNEVGDVPKGDEGGYSPEFKTLERPFEILKELIRGGEDMFLAIDAAANEFSDKKGGYVILGKPYTAEELIQTYITLEKTLGLLSIEDPFSEFEPGHFTALLSQVPENVIVVGDDLTVTNKEILKNMIALKTCNALIIKPNQIGTVSEVYDTVRMAHDAGLKTIVSHRSGETEDSFISDLAVGVGAYGMKAGAPSQKVRVAKYDRLVAIEGERNK